MFKKGFTLVEVMISIVLMGIMFAYLYSTLGNLRKSNKILEVMDKKTQVKERFINLIYQDVLEATNLKLVTKKSLNSVLELRTKNSLYNSNFVYVKWFLNIDNNILVRAESTTDFKLPVSDEKLHFVQFDEVLHNIDFFKCFQASRNNAILVSTKDLNNSKIFAIELSYFASQ